MGAVQQPCPQPPTLISALTSPSSPLETQFDSLTDLISDSGCLLSESKKMMKVEEVQLIGSSPGVSEVVAWDEGGDGAEIYKDVNRGEGRGGREAIGGGSNRGKQGDERWWQV
ncbi:hypothetical protein CCACVL1_18529 [Corchorus capsularis]|uniref:Uncharacterized protein n=1 Tax=Corchorus capsularis TaxID=210143 RepID=A0A1R3HKU8_COCAP|nr:hypothetical protein CCACVL1_18529 [Corchorus capsularis]